MKFKAAVVILLTLNLLASLGFFHGTRDALVDAWGRLSRIDQKQEEPARGAGGSGGLDSMFQAGTDMVLDDQVRRGGGITPPTPKPGASEAPIYIPRYVRSK